MNEPKRGDWGAAALQMEHKVILKSAIFVHFFELA
jgi:hypothetical protein